MLLGQAPLLPERDAVFLPGLRPLVLVREKGAQVVVAPGQFVAVVEDVGVLIDQALLLLECGAGFGLGLRILVLLEVGAQPRPQQGGEPGMALGQVAAVVGDRREVVDQLLPDRQRGPVGRLLVGEPGDCAPAQGLRLAN